MKNVLVVYFTQSGQLHQAAKATLAPLENDPDIKVHYEQLKPVKPFPFPWTYMQFFNVFPESVHAIPCELQPFSFDPAIDFDLIIIAYQPWFLSVSIPVNSFLQSEAAKRILKNKNVVTIIACRNMWLNAQEKMKKALLEREARLVGNIAYVDSSANLISLVTVLAFVLGGIKENFLGVFPKYGVQDKVLQEKAPQFGGVLQQNILKNNYDTQQQELNRLGAVVIKPNLMLLEGRGKVLFPLYANYISKKGKQGDQGRNRRVRIFGIVLPLAILILSPVISILSRLAPLVMRKKFKREMDYFSGNSLR